MIDNHSMERSEAKNSGNFRPWSELGAAIELMNCESQEWEESRLAREWSLTHFEFSLLQRGMRALVVEERNGQKITFQTMLSERRDSPDSSERERLQRGIVASALMRATLRELTYLGRDSKLEPTKASELLIIADSWLVVYDQSGLSAWGDGEVNQVAKQVKEGVLKDEIEIHKKAFMRDLQSLILKRRGADRLAESVNVWRAVEQGETVDSTVMFRAQETLRLMMRQKQGYPETMIDVAVNDYQRGKLAPELVVSLVKMQNIIARNWGETLWKELGDKYRLPDLENLKGILEGSLVECDDDQYIQNFETVMSGAGSVVDQLFTTQFRARLARALEKTRPDVEKLDRAGGEIDEVEKEWQKLVGQVLLWRVQNMGKGDLGNLQSWMQKKYGTYENMPVAHDDLAQERPPLATRLHQLSMMSKVLGLDEPNYNMMMVYLIKGAEKVASSGANSLAEHI